jgi:AcrR family transcriptional regulator
MISRRRPRQLRAQHTVDAILGAVSRILARDGIDAVTTNRIAEVAGVSIGSVYQYFPDKRAIYAALHERHADSMARLVESTLVAHAGRPPREVLRALVETLVDAHAAEPRLHLALAEVPHRAEGARSLATRLAGALRLALATGRSRAGSQALESRLFVLGQVVASLSHAAALERPAGLSLQSAKRAAVRATLACLDA